MGIVDAESARPLTQVLRSNLLKREGPCASRRRSRFTQVESDCEPLLHDGGVGSNDSEEETQVVSVHQAPANSVCETDLISGSQEIEVDGSPSWDSAHR